MKEALIKNRKERLILPSRKDESNQPAQSDSKKIVLETERLVVRQMAPDDFENVRRFLADPEVMYAYEHGFDDDEVRQWIAQNQKRYTQDGFGLWLIIEKKTGESIGDCGITWQEAKGKPVLEIGYHLEKKQVASRLCDRSGQSVFLTDSQN
ncbi:GNAT family N-acetyltransferase [Erysipelotrichaceae bacterium RD49]|nr:GNAT family N-acetyltransferase [Erysipelotrichaceae bacterium RD49]